MLRASRPIPYLGVFCVERVETFGIQIKALAKRLSGRAARYESFTYGQVLQAVQLFEYCGLYLGEFEEMWAYVFFEGRQVGYLAMYHEWPAEAMGSKGSYADMVSVNKS